MSHLLTCCYHPEFLCRHPNSCRSAKPHCSRCFKKDGGASTCRQFDALQRKEIIKADNWHVVITLKFVSSSIDTDIIKQDAPLSQAKAYLNPNWKRQTQLEQNNRPSFSSALSNLQSLFLFHYGILWVKCTHHNINISLVLHKINSQPLDCGALNIM